MVNAQVMEFIELANNPCPVAEDISLTIDLCLPDSISHPPQSRKDKENRQLVGMRFPVQEGNNTGDVCYRS